MTAAPSAPPSTPSTPPTAGRRRRLRIALACGAAALIAGIAIAIPLGLAAARTAEAEREAQALVQELTAACEVAAASSGELNRAAGITARYVETVLQPVTEAAQAENVGLSEAAIASVLDVRDELVSAVGPDDGAAELRSPFADDGFPALLALDLRDEAEADRARGQVAAEKERLGQVARDADGAVQQLGELLFRADEAVLAVVTEASAAARAAVEQHHEASPEAQAELLARADALALLLPSQAGDRLAAAESETVPLAEAGPALSALGAARTELVASHDHAVAERVAAEERARAEEEERARAEEGARARKAAEGSGSGAGSGSGSGSGSGGGGGGNPGDDDPWHDEDGNVCTFVNFQGMLIVTPCG